MLIELLVSAGLLGTLIAVWAVTQTQAGQWNQYELAREHCVAAAGAQLDNYTAVGKAMADDECKRLWPDVSLQVETSAGKGDWEGLTLVSAKATAKVGSRSAKVELVRYVATRPLGPTTREGQ
jgi:type II secretory pathway pseudopilin PulG